MIKELIKEWKEEIMFIKEHPIFSIFILGTLSGILPILAVALLCRLLGF